MSTQTPNIINETCADPTLKTGLGVGYKHNYNKIIIIAIVIIILTIIQFGINLIVYKKIYSNLSKYGLSTKERPSKQLEISEIIVENTSTREVCPLIPPKLFGRLNFFNDSLTFEEMEEQFSWLEPGGRHKPEECLSRNKVAIVVPYRNRDRHLRIFLYNIHPMLERQQLDYGVYIVEQDGDEKFNRAKLFNVGFLEALKHYDYQCFIFHDIDLIPEDDRNLYTCPESERPRHMTVAVEQFGYGILYEEIFGGVTALTTEQFKRINGFSNEFWGWGGEDDDLYNRVIYYGYNITRYPAEIARYKSLEHEIASPNPDRIDKLRDGEQRYKTDGINSIKYNLLEQVNEKLYTWILVGLGSP